MSLIKAFIPAGAQIAGWVVPLGKTLDIALPIGTDIDTIRGKFEEALKGHPPVDFMIPNTVAVIEQKNISGNTVVTGHLMHNHLLK